MAAFYLSINRETERLSGVGRPAGFFSVLGPGLHRCRGFREPGSCGWTDAVRTYPCRRRAESATRSLCPSIPHVLPKGFQHADTRLIPPDSTGFLNPQSNLLSHTTEITLPLPPPPPPPPTINWLVTIQNNPACH